MKRNKGFRVKKVKSTSGIYELARVFFCYKRQYDDNYKWAGFVEYQRKPGEQRYYGGSINLQGDEIHSLNYLNKIMNDIDKNVNGWQRDIKELLEYLENNYNRFVYDDREYEIIKINDVKPLEHQRYMLKDKDNKNCILSCIAKDRKAAIRGFKKKIGNILQEGSTWYDINYLADWLKNPKVILDRRNKAPEIGNIYEILGIETEEETEGVEKVC